MKMQSESPGESYIGTPPMVLLKQSNTIRLTTINSNFQVELLVVNHESFIYLKNINQEWNTSKTLGVASLLPKHTSSSWMWGNMMITTFCQSSISVWLKWNIVEVNVYTKRSYPKIISLGHKLLMQFMLPDWMVLML